MADTDQNRQENRTDSSNDGTPIGPDTGAERSSVSLLAKAVRAVGLALWFIAQAVFIGAVAGLAALRDEETRIRIRRWLLLTGDRWTVVGLLTAGIFAGVFLFGVTGTIGLNQGRFITGLFTALVSGMLSFIAIVVAVNHLGNSRVTGSPTELREDIQSVYAFRQDVEEMIDGKDLLSTEPSSFLVALARTLNVRAQKLQSVVDESDDADLNRRIDEYATLLSDRADTIEKQIHDGDMPLFEVLLPIMNDSYAKYVHTARRLQLDHADTLPGSADETLDELRDLFIVMNVTRQYFKQIYLHQVLSELSSLLAYTGLGTMVFSVLVVLTYATGLSPMMGEFTHLLFISVALAIALLPFSVLIAYVFRIATVLKRTSAPGAFTPEGEMPEYAEYPLDS